jgi:hypothetical protein
MSSDQQKSDQACQYGETIAENTNEEVNGRRGPAEGGAGTSNPPVQAGSANRNTDGAVNHSSVPATNDRDAEEPTAAEHGNSNNDAGVLSPPYTFYNAGRSSVNGTTPADGNTGALDPPYTSLFEEEK